MLTWVEKMPEFNTIDGVNLIEKCISCNSITSDIKLNEIVKKCQTHKCKHTVLRKVKINVDLIILCVNPI
jgi:hypothetical protein